MKSFIWKCTNDEKTFAFMGSEKHLAPQRRMSEVLVGFMQNELDISEEDTIEFKLRIHRIGWFNPSQDKPRSIIAICDILTESW